MMEREKGRSRKRVGRPLGLMNFLQREGRRCCAFMLCFTMIVGNTASMAVAAVKQESDVLFQLDRESLYAALQEAVLRNQVANEDFQFSGEAADDYDMLLGEMSNDMGELYELKREQTEDSDENEELSLRIFARLDGEIPLMDEEMTEEYQITGSEQFIFLLTNRTDKKQTAEIQVDDKRTEVITVLPGSSVDVREEETEKTEETETKKAGGGSTGGNKSEGNKTEVNVTEEDTTSQETESASVQETEETTETEQESVSEEETAKEEPSSEEGTDEEEIVSSEEESAEEETTQEDAATEEDVTEEETAADKEETEADEEETVQEDETDSADQASEAEESEEENGGAAEAVPEENAGVDQGSDEEKDAEANDSAEDIQADVEEDGENSVEEYSLSISRNEVSRVAFSLTTSKATSSDADKDEDKATPSDAEVEALEGVMYDTVYMNDEVVAAFVTTASDLGLDEDFWAEEPEEELPEVLPPQVIVPEKKTDVPQVFRQELDNVIVEVTAEEGVLPEDAELRVEELEEDGDQYQAAKEALDDAGTEYSGMMALDISFWVGDEEIEPDGNVQVSMKLRQKALPEEVKPESLVVQHLAEEDGKLSVEAVADYGEETNGTIEINENEHVTAEFEVESFSTFTITWTDPMTNETIKIGVKAYDQDTGEEINKDVNLSIQPSEDDGIYFADLSSANHTDAVEIEGYRYVEARYENNIITKLQVTILVVPDTGKWITVTGDNGLIIERDFAKEDSITTNIRLIYKTEPVSIEDTIKTDGCLTAKVSSDIPEKDIIYKWYRSDDLDFTDPTYIKDRAGIQGAGFEIFNLSEDGKSINVAVDGGARKYYKVEAYKKEGDKEVPIGVSDVFCVEYSDKLLNGGFEAPKVATFAEFLEGHPDEYYGIKCDWNNSDFIQCVNGTPDLNWKTTACGPNHLKNGKEDYYIEIVDGNTCREEKNAYTVCKTPEGIQFAELNAEKKGALYQDILTVPGSTLYWRLQHAGRSVDNETMYVVIRSTKDISDNWNPQDEEGIEEADYVAGICVADKPGEWQLHGGTYVVPKDQYVTRFYFVSGSSMTTMGNLLDDVSFSTELPEPVEDKGTVKINKVVEGIEGYGQIPAETFTFLIKRVNDDKTEEVVETVKLPTDTGSMIYVNSGMEPGDYRICEVQEVNGEYKELVPNDKLPSIEIGETKYDHVSTSVGLKNQLKEGFEYTGKIDPHRTTEIIFKNTYGNPQNKYKTLTVTKHVEGNGGNKKQDFKFELVVKDTEGKPVEIPASIEIWKNGDKVSPNNTFTLKDGESAVIKGIPSEYKVNVKELEAEDYQTTISRNKGNGPLEAVGGVSSKNSENDAIIGKVFELQMFEDSEVVFTNTKNITPPTGVHTHRLSHLLMMAMAALSMAGMAFTSACAKAHKKDED